MENSLQSYISVQRELILGQFLSLSGASTLLMTGGWADAPGIARLWTAVNTADAFEPKELLLFKLDSSERSVPLTNQSEFPIHNHKGEHVHSLCMHPNLQSTILGMKKHQKILHVPTTQQLEKK